MAVNFVATVCGDMFGSVRAWLVAAVVIFVCEVLLLDVVNAFFLAETLVFLWHLQLFW